MIDFPNSPTVGQMFSAAGVTWTWDGVKWANVSAATPYLPLVGGTLSGPLVTQIAPQAVLGSLNMVAAPASVSNSIVGFTGNPNAAGARWVMALGDGSPESGANAGSNLAVYNCNDAGVPLGMPMAMNRATGVTTFTNLSAPQAIGDNRIINGDMRWDQRNNGASGTVNGYTCDRWGFGSSPTGKGTWQRQTGGTSTTTAFTGTPYFLNFTSNSAYVATAADFFDFYQPIEADQVSDFAWGTPQAQPVTLSFWVYTSLTGTFSGAIRNYAGTRSYPFAYSIPAANTWTKLVVNIPGDTGGLWTMVGNAGSMYLIFDLGSGANARGPANAWATTTAPGYTGVTGSQSIVAVNGASFTFTGVKLEIGNVATPFNRQSLAKSLADCQRYYSGLLQIYGAGSGQVAGQPFIHGSLSPIWMRAAPTTVNLTTANSSNWTLVSVTSNNSSITANGNATAAGLVILNVLFALNAEL